MTSVAHHIRLTSAIPGRERWEVGGLLGRPRIAELLVRRLQARPWVSQASASAVSGRVLLVFDEERQPGNMGQLVLEALQLSTDELAAQSPLAQPQTQAGPDAGLMQDNALHRLLRPIAQDRAWRASRTSLLFSWSSIVTPIPPSLATTIAVTGVGISALSLWRVSPTAQLILFGGLYLLNKAVETVLDYKARTEWQRYASTVEHELRLKAFEHIEFLDMAYLEDKNTSQLLKIVHDDAMTIRRFLEVVPHTGISKVNALLLSGLFLIWTSPVAFGLAMLPVPVIWYFFSSYNKTISSAYLDQGEQEGAIRRQLSNSFSGLSTIRSLSSEELEREQLVRKSLALSESTYQAASLSLRYANLIKFAVTTGLVLPMVHGGASVLSGRMSVALYIMQTFILPKTIDTMIGIDQEYDLYQNAVAAAKRMERVLAVEPEVIEGDGVLLASDIKGDLRFDRLHFAYPSSSEIFQGFSLHVPVGSTTAIVGCTGSGKSTLIKLLLRFYDPGQGNILLDGVDIRSLQFSELRRAMGVVSQDVFLFHGTAYDNILYGRPGATREEVYEAAKIAHAYDFIMDLPQGFETNVGEWGKNLSGGQRQRISIARVILKNPPILILDEALSSVDNETEAAVQRAIDRVFVGRTTIFIAHRLSAIRHVNRIHVMQGGRIVEHGTHQKLMARNGVYADLWHLQTAGQRHGPARLKPA